MLILIQRIKVENNEQIVEMVEEEPKKRGRGRPVKVNQASQVVQVVEQVGRKPMAKSALTVETVPVRRSQRNKK